MSIEYPYPGRLSRWEEIAEGLAIVGVQAPEPPFPFQPGQYATLGLMGPEGKLVQRPMSISSSRRSSGSGTWATRSTSRAPRADSSSRTMAAPACWWRAGRGSRPS
jgi:NAD(P)H-flavin reductase